MVSQRPLHPDQSPGFKASHLSCANYTSNQCQAAVKLHGVFSPYHNESAFLPTLQFHRDSRRDSHQNHYAIRAGQNLPDKEFRYLRTVIWPGLRFELSLLLDLLAGSVSPYTRLATWQRPVLINSRLNHSLRVHHFRCETRFIPKLHLLFADPYEVNRRLVSSTELVCGR